MATNPVNQFRNGLRQIFDRASEEISYQSITRSRDADDNPVDYVSQSNVYVVVQILRLEDIQEIGGLLQVGDAMIFFNHSWTVTKEDRIIHKNIYYRIIDAIPERVAGEIIFTQALCKREEHRPQGETHFITTLSEILDLEDSLTNQQN